MSILYYLIPIGRKQRLFLESLKGFEDYKKIKSLLQKRKIRLNQETINLTIFRNLNLISIETNNNYLKSYTEKTNPKIKEFILNKYFIEFSQNAFNIISQNLASEILDLEFIKKSLTLQLFSKERIHILLLGDPGTGKTQLLHSISELAPISSFGLGSGISGVGLTATIKGKEVYPGLLPRANNGIAAIDELNLLKEEDRGSLLNAMEKGFVTYDKGAYHKKFDANVRLVAAANPKKSQFKGNSLRQLKDEIPFDPALLTRFHLVFLIRKPNLKQFIEITKKIVSSENKNLSKEDIDFIKGYINFTYSINNIEFPKDFEQRIINFITEVKKNENSFLIDISPRIVIGLIRLCQASARSEYRNRVQEKDLQRAFNILTESLKII